MRRALAQWLSVTRRVSAVSQQRSVVTVSVALDDDTEQELLVQPGTTLLEAIDASDFSDVWEGGACGGSCACSTCRVIVDEAWGGKLAAPDDDELDLLDDGAAQAAKASGAAAADAIANGETGTIGNDDFMAIKITTMQIYITHHLPKLFALGRTIADGDAPILAMQPDWL